MRCKNDKKYQICHHQIRFFKLKMHQNPFLAGLLPGPRWGSLRRSPRPPNRLGRGIPPLGRGIPPPHSPPHSTPLASRTRRLRRLGSQAPSTQNPGYARVSDAVPLLCAVTTVTIGNDPCLHGFAGHVALCYAIRLHCQRWFKYFAADFKCNNDVQM